MRSILSVSYDDLKGLLAYLVTGDDEVRLETHFVALRNRRVDLSAVRVVHAEGDTSALEEGLEEELGVECEWC